MYGRVMEKLYGGVFKIFMEALVDLHLHSVASDGSFRPAEVMRMAKEAGMTAAALTDHDTLDGIAEARAEAQRLRLSFLPGIELAAQEEFEIHILGYGVNETDCAFLKQLQALKENRLQRNEKIFSALRRQGIDLSWDDVAAFSKDSVVTRAHFAMALTEKGVCAKISEAFERYLDPGRPAYIPRMKLTAQEAIDWIHQAGGLAVLAHPFQYSADPAVVEALVSRMKQAGMDGIECYYSRYDEIQTEKLLGFAKSRAMLITGGSDFHGAFKPGLLIGSGYGTLRVPDTCYRALTEALAKKQS